MCGELSFDLLYSFHTWIFYGIRLLGDYSLPPIVTRIVNLATGGFCHFLLKKPSLGKENLSNYKPISNLSVVSEVTEHIVKSGITDYIT